MGSTLQQINTVDSRLLTASAVAAAQLTAFKTAVKFAGALASGRIFAGALLR